MHIIVSSPRANQLLYSSTFPTEWHAARCNESGCGPANHPRDEGCERSIDRDQISLPSPGADGLVVTFAYDEDVFQKAPKSCPPCACEAWDIENKNSKPV